MICYLCRKKEARFHGFVDELGPEGLSVGSTPPSRGGTRKADGCKVLALQAYEAWVG